MPSDTAFIAWQREHTAALAALQDAQRAYHRSVAATAFQGAAEASAEETRRAALDALDAARIKLDEVRARRPRTEGAS